MKFNTITKLLLSLVLIIASGINARAVTLLAPADSAECVSESPILLWEPQEDAVSYTLEIADDEAMTNLIYTNAEISNISDTANLAMYGSTLWWRVIAEMPEDVLDTSEVRTFTTRLDAPATVTLDSLKCTELTLELEWTDETEIYYLQMATDEAFENIIINNDSLDTNAVMITVEDYNSNYYWRIAAFYDDCRTAWSTLQMFTTKHAPALLNFPPNDTTGIATMDGTEANTIAAEWQDIENAEFTFQASYTSAFAPEDIIAEELTDTNFVEFQIPDTNNVAIYWRVGYTLDECFGEWSETYTLKTEYEAVSLLTPMELDSCVDYSMATFCWDTLQGALGYKLQIASHPIFENINQDTLIFLDSEIIPETCLDFGIGLPNQEFYWRVRAEDSTNTGAWSVVYMNKTTSAPPMAVYPPDDEGGLDLNVTMVWDSIGTEDYRYHFQLTGAQGNYNVAMYDTMYHESNTFDVILPEKSTTYYWRVRVMNPDSCWSAWSPEFQFRTNIDAPILISPADGATKVPPSIVWFQWHAVEDADTYLLQISKDSDFETVLQEEIELLDTTNIIIDFEYEENTTYYWRAKAVNEDGESDWSEVFNFTTWIYPPTVPVIIYPEPNADKIPMNVELEWSNIAAADEYRLKVYQGLQQIPIIDTVVTSSTFQLNGLEPYTYYFWNVVAINEAGESNSSITASFRTVNIPPTEKAVGIYPADGADELPVTLTLSWGEVEYAIYYLLQVSTDMNFSNIVREFNNLPEPSRQIFSLDQGTTYYWRVRGWNAEGEGPWSDVMSFTTFIDLSVDEEFTKELGLNVYPNPADNNANISFVAPIGGKAEITLYDANGNAVSTIFNGEIALGENTIPVNIEALASGVYYYPLNINGKIAAGAFAVSK